MWDATARRTARPRSRSRSGPLRSLLAVALAACPAPIALAVLDPVAAAATRPKLTLERLAGLQNYRFTSSASNGGYTFRLSGIVHGPRDWETRSTLPVKETTYDVNGRGFTLVIGHIVPVTFKTPDGLTHLDGERSAAESLIGYTRVRGIRIATGGSCRVAGRSGTTYHLKTPRNAASLLVETATACVANGSGALLSYTAGVPSGSVLKSVHLRGATLSFKVDGIGTVGVIRAPKAHATAA